MPGLSSEASLSPSLVGSERRTRKSTRRSLVEHSRSVVGGKKAARWLAFRRVTVTMAGMTIWTAAFLLICQIPKMLPWISTPLRSEGRPLRILTLGLPCSERAAFACESRVDQSPCVQWCLLFSSLGIPKAVLVGLSVTRWTLGRRCNPT